MRKGVWLVVLLIVWVVLEVLLLLGSGSVSLGGVLLRVVLGIGLEVDIKVAVDVLAVPALLDLVETVTIGDGEDVVIVVLPVGVEGPVEVQVAAVLLFHIYVSF